MSMPTHSGGWSSSIRRLPRVLFAITCGIALAISGAIFQSLTRNPLGSPDIIGFSTGSYTGVVVLTLWVGSTRYYDMAAAALVGGIITAAVVYLLAISRGKVQAFRLIIMGIGVGAILGSLTSALMLSVDVEAAMLTAVWAAGSLNSLGHAQLWPMVALLVVMLVLVVLIAPGLRQLELGDDAARSLGTSTNRGARQRGRGRCCPDRAGDRRRRADLLHRTRGSPDRPPPGRRHRAHAHTLGIGGCVRAARLRCDRPRLRVACRCRDGQRRRRLPHLAPGLRISEENMTTTTTTSATGPVSEVPHVPTSAAIEVEHVRVGYDKRIISEDVSISVPTGGYTAIIGPNACGKSTLLRAVSRILPYTSGSILLEGQDISRIPTKKLATRLGLLPQSSLSPEGIRGR